MHVQGPDSRLIGAKVQPYTRACSVTQALDERHAVLAQTKVSTDCMLWICPSHGLSVADSLSTWVQNDPELSGPDSTCKLVKHCTTVH